MSEPNAMPDLSGMIEKIAGNPAALNMLTALLGRAQESKSSAPAPPLRPEAKHAPKDERVALLLALKPFLSKEKQSAVERMIRMLELTSVIRSVMAEGGNGEHV